MTKQEILKKIEDLEKWRFFLNMQDRWSVEDSMRDTKMANEIRVLKEMVAITEA